MTRPSVAFWMKELNAPNSWTECTDGDGGIGHAIARALEVAEGNRAQAALELEISENTLRVYIESARHKLGALNTTHAVARALGEGQIVV